MSGERSFLTWIQTDTSNCSNLNKEQPPGGTEGGELWRDGAS